MLTMGIRVNNFINFLCFTEIWQSIKINLWYLCNHTKQTINLIHCSVCAIFLWMLFSNSRAWLEPLTRTGNRSLCRTRTCHQHSQSLKECDEACKFFKFFFPPLKNMPLLLTFTWEWLTPHKETRAVLLSPWKKIARCCMNNPETQ